MTRWVAVMDAEAPIYGDTRDDVIREVQSRGLLGECLDLRPVDAAEVDEAFATELARWETLPLLALSVADLTAGIQSLSARELERLLTAEARGRGRSTALGAIATALRKAEGAK